MQELDIESVEAYAASYAAKLCSEYFPKAYRLSGEDIVSACEVRQVNMLVVKDIFLDWKLQAEKLKNSYFDYSHPQVKKILDQLTSELSKHILMPVELYELYLAKAVKETLNYCLDPDSYLFELMEMFADEQAIDIQEVLDVFKYLSIHPALHQAIVSDIELCGTMIFVRDLIDIIQLRTSEQELLQDCSEILDGFKSYLDFDLNSWWIKQAESDQYHSENEFAKDEEFEPLFSDDDQTFEEVLQQELQPIESQSNEFLSVLFGGNQADFDEAMNRVSTASSYSEAISYLRNTFAKKYNWQSGVVLSKFLDQIDSHFD
jgi:hypothetical protein